MQTVAAHPGNLTISKPVDAFAKERGLAPYLPSLAALLQRLFPDAVRLSAELHDDTDVPDLRWILFEAEGPWSAEQLNAATDEWYRRTAEICPPALISEFGLLANRLEP